MSGRRTAAPQTIIRRRLYASSRLCGRLHNDRTIIINQISEYTNLLLDTDDRLVEIINYVQQTIHMLENSLRDIDLQIIRCIEETEHWERELSALPDDGRREYTPDRRRIVRRRR